MSFDYFYGQQSDLFTFYRVPKVLFTNERFWNISADAKMLYGILLDRMSLSAKNGWIDKNGRVYIIFTIDEAKMALNCAEQKAIKLLSELEKKAGLIERKRQGLGKPNLIYVKNFISAVDSQLLNCENHNSGTMEITTQELPKSQCNNTDIKNTEFSDTDSIFPSGNGGMMDENDRYQEYFDYFSDQLSMDLLKKDYPYDSEMLDNILELIVETVCTKRPLIRIGAEERPAEIVRSRFMKLNAEHIRYVMDCFKENTTKIRNIRQYMLTTIYNAPTTIDTYYDIQNRLVCFDIKELGNQLKKIGMLIVQDQVWGRVTANRSAGKSTRYYIDEFHLLLKEEQTATYSVEIWKRFRKWGGLPTGITQNVKDLLRSPEIANILENSDFIYMLNQASDDRSILAQRLNISPHQLSYVTNSGEGEGLLFYGNVILPFIDRFPTDLELYRIMTTKLNEVAQEKEA